MSPRIRRTVGCGLLLALLATSSAASVITPPQDQGTPEDKVAAFVRATREVARFGAAAAPVLADHAKAATVSTAAFLATVADSLRGKAEASGTDTAPTAIDPAVKRLVTVVGDLVRLKDLALPPIQAAVADPANADVKDLLANVEGRIHVQLCVAAIKSYIRPDNTYPGTFDGMFAMLDKYDRAKVSDGFLEIFQNPRQGAPLRDLAGEGLAQTGSARHLDAVRAIWLNDKQTERVRLRALYTLARLGDRGPVDNILANLAARMEHVKKPDMTPEETRAWAEGYLQSATMAQAIHDTPGAIKYYELFVSAVEPITDKLGGRGGLRNAYYNMACLYSLNKDIDAALGALEKAFGAGYSDFKWANEDGDLANLRKDPRFKATIEKWEAPKKPAPPPESRPS